MFGWLRRKRSNDPGETGWAPDPAPTPAERRDELLSAYLDDDLPAAERADLEARLETDASLRDALAGMRTVRDTLATLEVVRAPRSFAIAAPPSPEARRGFRPVDIAARFGAMAAAVAFVAVLAGDLSDGGPTIEQSDISTTLSADAGPDAGVDDAAFAQTAQPGAGATGDLEASQPAPAADPESAPGDTLDEYGADAPAPDATPEAPLLDGDPPGQAAAVGTAERSATEGPAAAVADDGAPDSGQSNASGGDGGNGAAAPPPLPPNTGGAVDPTDDASPDVALDEDGATSEDPETSALQLPQPAPEGPDTARVDSDADPGTLAAESALGTQSGESVTTAADADAANALADDGREVSNLAIGLGAAAALLAAVSGLLWWRRREGTVGPV